MPKITKILVVVFGLLLGALIVYTICYVFPSELGTVETNEFYIETGE